MTDNFNEFEEPHELEHHDEPSMQPAQGIRGNLTSAWKSQPLFKLFVLLVVVGAVVAVAVGLFSSSASKSAVGLLKPPEMHEAPGGKSSPYLKEQTEMANQQRTQEALQSGGSALPTPIGPGNDNGELGAGLGKEDPLNELRAEVESMNKQIQETKQQQAIQQAPQANEQFDDSLAQAMQKQMSQLLDSWAPKGTKDVMVSEGTNNGAGGAGGGKDQSESNPGKQVDVNKAPAAAAQYKTLVNAGTVSYAQLLTEANSDVPGPILALIVSGPLKGARAVGHFKVDQASNYLVLTFNLANKGGTDYGINALALDPDTTLGGMATETDQRYLTRLILPAAAGFLQGFGQALGEGNSYITTNGTTTIVQQTGNGFKQGEYQGLGAAAQTASQFFQNQANNTHPLVRVAAGTPMGMFFIESVTDQNYQAYLDQQRQQQLANAPNTLGGLGSYWNGGQGINGGNGYAGYNPYTGYNNAAGIGGASNAGYSVLYPGANLPITTTPNSINQFGATQGAYPGSTVYYTH